MSGYESGASLDDAGVERFEWRAQEVPATGGINPKVRGRRIAIVGCGEAEAHELLTRLGAHGAIPVRIPPVPHEPGAHPAVDTQSGPAETAQAQLRELLIESGRVVDGIIDLGVGSLDVVEASSSWPHQLAQTLDVLRIVADGWGRESGVDRCFYAPVLRTGGFLATAGHVENPHGGMWAGLAKGLPRELTNLNIRIIDFPAECPPAQVADGVCEELYWWGLYEIGRVGGRRYTPVARRVSEPPPTLRLGAADTVLLSGGGRGIGFELAIDLASTLGCRVVVTGRGQLPDKSDEILSLSPDAFRQYRTERLRQAGMTGTVRLVRGNLDAIERDRELLANLARAEDAGARIEYHQCDVTDPDAVEALVAELSGSLAVVVHNAGFDATARLMNKSNAQAEAIIRVKVDGLLNLLAAVDAHADPEVFSVVGSLTGRLGGMVGQLDYGAANETISYLARWACAVSPPGMSIHALAWPTWEQLGMVSNYEASLAYMAAMPVERGVELWRGEILGRSEGEIAFHAEVGSALTPNLVRGYPWQSQLPGIEQLGAVVARCGEISEFTATREFATSIELAPAGGMLSADFTVDGQGAVPVSVVLEQMMASAAWVVAGPQRFVPVGVEALTVQLSGLVQAATSPCTVQARRGERRTDGAVQVDVVAVSVSCAGQLLATGQVLFALAYPRVDTDSPRSGRTGGRHRAPTSPAGSADTGVRLAWRGFALDLAAGPGGVAGPDRLRDQFPMGPTPIPVFGHSTIESLLERSYTGGPVVSLSINALRIAAAADPQASALVTVRPAIAGDGDDLDSGAELLEWSAAEPDGFTWLTADSVAFEAGRSASEPPAPVAPTSHTCDPADPSADASADSPADIKEPA